MTFAKDTMARNEIEQRMFMLAVRAKDGNTECLTELWGYVDRLCAWYCRKLCQQLPDRYLLEYEDLYNCGYIALCDAVAHFDPASESKFSAYYLFYLTSAIFRENSLPRGRRGKDGEKHHDPIISKGNTSLDAPLKSADEKPRTLQDSLCAPCEDGEDRSIAGAIDRIYLQQLHEALEALILQLSDEEQYFVRQNYFGGVSRKAIAKELQITPHQIIQVEDRTLRRLREKGKTSGLEQFISGRVNYYAGTGLKKFKESGSSIERLAEHRMELENRYKKLLSSNHSEENAHGAQ